MKITFLGTNGWYSNETGDTTCILIETADQYVVLDAGNGLSKLDGYITKNKHISLFISHFHIDHVSGLHTLMKLNLRQGIDVYVGEERSKDFETFVNPPFTIGYRPKPENISTLKTEIRLHELSEGGEDIPFRASATKQHHAYIDHGYKMTLEGKVLAYTGDCGLTPDAGKLAEGADLLISECSYKKTPSPDEWGHLDPMQAATLASESGVGRLILTHFNPYLYTSLEDRDWAEGEARKIFPNTTAAKDGMEFSI